MIKIRNPVPVVMMHLLWEHPRPWVLPRVKTLQDFLYFFPPLFSSDTPSGVTRGEMKKENKKRGWVFQKVDIQAKVATNPSIVRLEECIYIIKNVFS
jgi:hypothetical protein